MARRANLQKPRMEAFVAEAKASATVALGASKS